jgi:hypothetical protein
MDMDNSTIVLILYCVLAFVLAFYPAYLIREEAIAGKRWQRSGSDRMILPATAGSYSSSRGL